MDATANEVAGLNIQGFPTIKFYPANNKTPLDFDGDRTTEGFVAYLKDHASRAVDFGDLKEEGSEEKAEEVADEPETTTEEEVRDEL